MNPPFEETFAGNSWRVEERPERGSSQRFVVLGKAPGTFGAEVEICAVQYSPHAEAIAALPELARLVELSDAKETRRSQEWFSALSKARAKAEGRS